MGGTKLKAKHIFVTEQCRSTCINLYTAIYFTTFSSILLVSNTLLCLGIEKFLQLYMYIECLLQLYCNNALDGRNHQLSVEIFCYVLHEQRIYRHNKLYSLFKNIITNLIELFEEEVVQFYLCIVAAYWRAFSKIYNYI